MAKINLLDFSKSFEYRKSPVTVASFSNVDFERLVIDKIIGWSNWQPCVEYYLLSAFLKKGGRLENLDYFLSNIEKLKSHHQYRGSDLIYSYSKNVLKKRLSSEHEKAFLKDLWGNHYGGRSAYKYAKYVLRDRLPVEYEKGCNDLDYLGFVETKGYDISEILINSSTLSFYYYRKHCYLPEVVHNFMIAMQLSGDYYARTYFRQRVRDDKIIKGRLRMMDSTKTISDVLKTLKG